MHRLRTQDRRRGPHIAGALPRPSSAARPDHRSACEGRPHDDRAPPHPGGVGVLSGRLGETGGRVRIDAVDPAVRARAVAAAQGRGPCDLRLAGGDLYGPDVDEMLSWDEVGGLAEVMDMLGVLGGADRMVDVVAAGLESGKLVSGHAAGLTGPLLQAYLAAGMTSDHEIFTEPDCLEKLRAGLTVELRGMIDPILPGIVAELNSLRIPPTHLVAATD